MLGSDCRQTGSGLLADLKALLFPDERKHWLLVGRVSHRDHRMQFSWDASAPE